MEGIQIKHEERIEGGKFWIFYEGIEAGFIQYEWLPNGNFKANGTLVYDEFRDKKLGKPLFDALMNFAREKKVKIYPTCPFVVLSMKRDESTHDLWADDYKKENNL
jgi:predicted GNAT family acetyltransferase